MKFNLEVRNVIEVYMVYILVPKDSVTQELSFGNNFINS